MVNIESRMSDIAKLADVIIICEIDAFLGPITTPMLKERFGKITIIHQEEEKDEEFKKLNDQEKLDMVHTWFKLDKNRSSNLQIISTCWKVRRTALAVRRSRTLRNKRVRIYILGQRMDLGQI